MKEGSSVLHVANRDKNRHLHLLLLLLPSIVFVVVLALFLRNRYDSEPLSVVSTEPTPSTPSSFVQINDVTIQVRLAKTQAEQTQGLSGVESLGEKEGMLFVFPEATNTAFWMKDMKMKLDIIWIAKAKIIQIDKNIPFPTPGTADSLLKLYIPNVPIDQVLEVNAGFSDLHSIKIGDTVVTSNL